MPDFPSRDEVRNAKAALAAQLKDVGGITSMGIGKATLSSGYIVRVTVRDERTAKKIPPQSEGVPVEVSVSGDFSAQ